MKLLSNVANVVHCDPDIMGGIPVFAGTRIPIKTLLDYLEAGDSLNIFLDHFPSVSREQAIAALELAIEMLTTYANPVSSATTANFVQTRYKYGNMKKT